MTNISGVFLHDQHRVASRHQLLEYRREIFRHLLERQLDRFILALVQMVDQIFDRLPQTTQLLTFMNQKLSTFYSITHRK